MFGSILGRISRVASVISARLDPEEDLENSIVLRPSSTLGKELGYTSINRSAEERRRETRKKARKNRRIPPLGRLDTSGIKTIASVLSAADENPDEVLLSRGVAVYDEMEAKDAHVYAVYQTRRLAISLIPWEIIPANKSKRAAVIAEFVFSVIEDCKGPFSEDIKQLTDAIGKGFSILEIVWKYIAEGKWKGKYGIEELVFHKQRYWFFKDGRWHKQDSDIAMFGPDRLNAKEIPWEKIVHYAYDSQDSLYGRAAFKPIYWFSWLKREGWKSWIIFLNRYGSPITKGTFPENTPQLDQDKLLEVLQTIQEETALIHPKDFDVSFLEAGHAAAASFRELSDSCNAEISKGILGATQTVEEGKRGSYALSKAHSEVRRERIDADTVDICDVIQEQLIKRIVDFNFMTDEYPQFVMRRVATKETPPPGSGRIGEAVVSEPAAVTPVELGTQTALPSPEKIESPPLSPSPEQAVLPGESPTLSTSEILKAVEHVKDLAVKTFAKRGHPVINVSAIKLLLSERIGPDRAHDLAGRVKSYVERRISRTNVDEVFSDAASFLTDEIGNEFSSMEKKK